MKKDNIMKAKNFSAKTIYDKNRVESIYSEIKKQLYKCDLFIIDSSDIINDLLSGYIITLKNNILSCDMILFTKEYVLKNKYE